MKKITLLLIMFMSTCYLNAQVVAYSFSQSNGTYTEISGGTLLGTETSDDQRFVDPATPAGGTVLTGVGLPIGFNFVFNGVVYDRFAVNNNGWISLGMSSLGAAAVNMNTTSAYTPTRSTSTAVTDELVARISGLGRDLQAQVGSTLSYALTGTAPNQVLVVQFKNYRKFNVTGDNFNFQIKLYETSNLVEVVYGTQVNNATSSTYDVGLRASPAATATNFNSRTSTTSWSATTSSVDALGAITMDATIIPASGLTFTWTPPTCPGATGIALTSLTNSSADVTWTQPTPLPSNGYQYVVTSTVGLPTGAGTPSATNMVSATGLTANTTYYVYVRSDCGSSFGNWILSGTFKTLCDEVSAFVQNFDTYPSGTTSLPDCWSKAGTSANVYITTGALAPMSPSNRLYMNVSATTSAFAILAPVSNLQANTHRLKFKAYASTANKSMSIGYFATPGDITSYVEVEPVQLPGTAIASTQEFTIIPSSIPAGVTQLVFNTTQPTPSATTVYIDDVKWEVNSSCIEPTALTATVITSTSATLGWTNGGAEAMWDIQYGPNNFALGSGTFVNGVTTNPHVLGGLTPNTIYQYYVRAVCTGPVNSSWTGPLTFKTQCTPTTAPYTEGFENAGVIPSCWTMGGGENWLFSNTGGFNHIGNNGTITGSTTTGGYFAWVDDSSPDFSDVTLTSPLIDASALTAPRLTFYELSNNEGFQNSTLTVEVWDGAAWNAMAQYNTNTPGGWEKKVISLSSLTITGNIQVRFIYAGDTTGFYDDIAIDDVTIEETPATPPACATNIIATPNATCGNEATVMNWDATPLADGYYLTMGTTMGGTDILNNVDIGAAPTYSYIGLLNTTYYYTVYPYNASGTSTGCTENTFTTVATGCYCPSVPTSNDALGITNVQLGTTDFPTTDVTYFDHSATQVTLPQGVNSNVQISFATGYTYNTYIWIDLNDNYIFDASELVYTGESLSTNPTVLNASFIMPATAAIGVHKMRIVTADALTTANPCYSGSYGVTLDFSVNIIAAPSCIPPTALTASSISSSSANLGWTESATATVWDIEWGTSGFTPTGTPNIAATTTNPEALSGLTPNTSYSFYVRANCGGTNGESSWSGPFSFTTTCLPYTIPYFEGFESGYSHNSAVAGCLAQESVTGTGVWTANNTFTDYNRTPRTGSWNAFLQYGNEDWIFIPIELVGGTSYTVDLYARQDGATGNNSNVLVSYGSSATAAAMTNAIVPATNIVNGNYQQITGAFTPGTNGTYYVGIKGFMNFSPWYISLDDIKIDVTPACAAPNSLVVTNITSTSANISWVGTTGNYEYVLNNTATAPTGSGTATTLITYSASTLTPLTTYYFHVRSDCGSAWTTTSFTTLATPPVNDECANPTVLTPGGVFATNQVTGTNVAATSSTQTAPTCAFYQGGDVWYSAVVPASGSLTFEVNPTTGGLTDTGGAVYSGICSSLTEIACNDSSSASGDHPLIIVTGQTPGSVLYFRVWEYGNDVFGTFLVSAYDASLSASSFDNASFVAYPNPVKDVLNLSYSSEISSVKVINLLGQEVISRKVNNTTSQIDMTSLTAGAYIVNVTVGDVVKTIKVIKQ